MIIVLPRLDSYQFSQPQIFFIYDNTKMFSLFIQKIFVVRKSLDSFQHAQTLRGDMCTLLSRSLPLSKAYIVVIMSLRCTLCVCMHLSVCPSVHMDLSEPELLHKCMDFKIIWHNCSL